MKNVNKFVKIFAKICEVSHWVGAALMFCVAVCSKAAPQLVGKFVSFDFKEGVGADLSAYALAIEAPYVGGNVDMKLVLIFAIACIFILALAAMIFRNLYLIFKLSENSTPFQKDILRMVKEIGIFCIAIPVIGFIATVVVNIVFGNGVVETSVDHFGVAMGLVVLCLTQVFSRGLKLEKDAEGLI